MTRTHIKLQDPLWKWRQQRLWVVSIKWALSTGNSVRFNRWDFTSPNNLARLRKALRLHQKAQERFLLTSLRHTLTVKTACKDWTWLYPCYSVFFRSWTPTRRGSSTLQTGRTHSNRSDGRTNWWSNSKISPKTLFQTVSPYSSFSLRLVQAMLASKLAE